MISFYFFYSANQITPVAVVRNDNTGSLLNKSNGGNRSSGGAASRATAFSPVKIKRKFDDDDDDNDLTLDSIPFLNSKLMNRMIRIFESEQKEKQQQQQQTPMAIQSKRNHKNNSKGGDSGSGGGGGGGGGIGGNISSGGGNANSGGNDTNSGGNDVPEQIIDRCKMERRQDGEIKSNTEPNIGRRMPAYSLNQLVEEQEQEEEEKDIQMESPIFDAKGRRISIAELKL